MATQTLSQNELIHKVQELKELKLMAEELAAEITGIEDAIKAEMTARDVAELIAGPFKVRWTPVVSQRFDSSAFKATHAELYKQYTKPVQTRRFSVC